MATANKFTTTFLAIALLGACGDDGAVTDDNGPGGSTGSSSAQCDPVGVEAEVGMLLNAPVEADVEVIIKQPQHPGAPGPENLP